MPTVEEILGADAAGLLQHQCKTSRKSRCTCRAPTSSSAFTSTRTGRCRCSGSCSRCSITAGSAGTGYVSILPVDQGIEHSAGASFAPNPQYFDPENIVKLAIEGGCNAVASTLGVLGMCARKYAHKIPFILKFNHNEFISYPNSYDQIRFASVKQGFDMGAAGVGATIYFGSEESKRQIQEVGEMFQHAHELGMFTVLWCYLRNSAFKTKDVDYHLAADLTGQANHLGVTIEADIIKQKLPETNGGYNAINFGKTHKKVYSELSSDHPIDLTRYQLANCYMGRAGLINSGGASAGESDLKEAVKTSVINKRAGGMGLISGRKAFQRPMKEGVGAAERDPGRLLGQAHHGRVKPQVGSRCWPSAVIADRRAAADATRLFSRRRVHGLRRSRHPGARPSPSSFGPSLRSRHRVFVRERGWRESITGSELPAFRAISLLCAALAILLDLACLFARLANDDRRRSSHRIARRDLDSVLGHGHERPLLRAVPRDLPCDAALDSTHRHLRGCADRWRARRAADPRARLHARADSARLLAASIASDRRRWI